MNDYTPHAVAAPASSQATLLTLVNAVLRRARVILAVALALGLLAAGISYWRKEYVATSVLAPQASQRMPSQFAGLAAQFGLSVGATSGEESPEFYAEVLKSRELLRQVASTRYRFAAKVGSRDTIEGNLLSLYGVSGRTPEERLALAAKILDKKVQVRANAKVGVVTLATQAKWPELAVKLNRRLLDALNEFNLQTRQSHANAERRFVEERMRLAQDALREAEAAVTRFNEANRRYQESPALAAEMARLQRHEQLQQEVYSTLAKAYEQARIDEVRNTPVVTIVDPPEGTVERSGRGAVVTGVLGFGVGLALGIAFVLATRILALHRVANPREFEEFQSLRRSIGLRLRQRRP